MEVCNLGDNDAGGSGSDDPTAAAVLTCLTFLEHKIGHLRGIITAAPRPPRQMVSAELSCIAVQLASISSTLAAATTATGHGSAAAAATTAPDQADDEHGGGATTRSSPAPNNDDGNISDSSSYGVIIELGKEEIMAPPHVHTCKVCGKGFKRDANLRMHMRGHGEPYIYKPPAAKPTTSSSATTVTTTTTSSGRCVYSCPFAGCMRNRRHGGFQPLKTAVCVRNHYRRSHCAKSHACARCGGVKRFAVLADLRTHEKHCGRDRWVCSCGASFSSKDKLFAHVAAFFDGGHAPALPPDDDGDVARVTTMDTQAAGSRVASMEFFLPEDAMLDALTCSDSDIKGFGLMDGDGQRCLDDDGPGSLSPLPMGMDFCDFDGFDLFGASAIDFSTQEEENDKEKLRRHDLSSIS